MVGCRYSVNIIAPAVLGVILIGGCKPPAAQGPLAAKPKLDCTIAQFPPIPAGPPLTAINGLIGGTFFAPSFEVPANIRATLTQDLVVVTNDDIDIAGVIQIGARKLGDASINILLISLHGNIKIWQTGILGGGEAAQGEPVTDNGPWAYASAGHGANGGWIKLVAEAGSIDIEGNVNGNSGGRGGAAIADSTTATNPGLKPFLWIPLIGSARAMGGDAGDGGDIYLCANESIHLGAPAPPGGGRVYGAAGGVGGGADAKSENGLAYARAGSQTKGRGTGGFVYIDLAGQGPPVQMFVDGFTAIYGGDGFTPVDAEATGSSSRAPAQAEGGPGGPGGEVKFGSVVVWNRGTIQSGGGANGGNAHAEGGSGNPGAGNGNGLPGGDAVARGGPGAPPGLPPVYLDGTVNPWKMVAGTVGRPGAGGSASAKGGRGGQAGPGGQRGGPSGQGTAFGGTGIRLGAPAAPVQSGPNAANNNLGANGTTAAQPGNP